MENFCGKCGSRLDPQAGLCPKCDQERIKAKQTRQNKQGKVRNTVLDGISRLL